MYRSFADVVVPYIGTWIETYGITRENGQDRVVPYIGTWIETHVMTPSICRSILVVPYIGTWIETHTA